MNDEELKLLGLSKAEGILDTNEKVAKLEEELSREMEIIFKNWQVVRREFLKEASTATI